LWLEIYSRGFGVPLKLQQTGENSLRYKEKEGFLALPTEQQILRSNQNK